MTGCPSNLPTRRELLAAVGTFCTVGCSRGGTEGEDSKAGNAAVRGDATDRKENPGTGGSTEITQWGIFEESFTVSRSYSKREKYTNVELSCSFTGPEGNVTTVPGFWDGDDTFRVRFAPSKPGSWTWNTVSNDLSLDGHSDRLTVVSPTEHQMHVNPNYRGFLRTVTTDASRYFEYADGTPFYYVSGTGWDGNSDQFPFETDFKTWVDDRQAKGMTVLQVLVCEASTGYGGSRNTGINEGGRLFAGSKSSPDYGEINPDNLRWFDKRIEYIHGSGLVPNIYFEWSDQYNEMTEQQLRWYYRHLVARYGAYNTIWTLSGEWNRDTDNSQLVRRLGQYVDTTDERNHLTTIHPWPGSTTEDFLGDSWIDFHTHQSQDKNELRMLEADWNVTEKPLVNSEPHVANNADFENRLDVRRDAWQILTSGRAAGLAHLSYPVAYDTDTFSDVTELLDGAELEDVKRAYQYFSTLDWWRLVPDMDLVVSDQSDDDSSMKVSSYLPDGSLELIYYSDNNDTRIALTPIDSGSAEVTWMRTTDGTRCREGTFDTSTVPTLSPPSGWTDALLIVKPT